MPRQDAECGNLDRIQQVFVDENARVLVVDTMG